MTQCPKCRAGLSPADLDGLPAQTCKECGGLWLAREFVELWSNRRGNARGVETPPLELDLRPPVATRLQCPECAVGLDRVDVKGIGIEHCSSCQGLFFDRGELEAMAGANRDNVGPDNPMIHGLRRAPPPGSFRSSETWLDSIGDALLAVLEILFDH